MRVFRPHDDQVEAIRHLTTHRRAGLWQPMGGGKTVATLTALEALDLVEDVYPVLVLAPLRVARSTWPDEIRKWAHTAHLRVSVVTGSVVERRAALAVKADIYTMNYDNLVWLRDHLGGEWPFKTVVADESTRLKSLRMQQGGKRAAALAKVAHGPVERFWGLTGTPSPNGIKDLWGPTWFMDKGHRLGSSFTAFEHRWFRPDESGYGIIPFDHSQEEVEGLLRDLCLTVRGEPADAPVVSPVYIDLPPEARKLYKDMEDEAFVWLEANGIEAFNSAVRINKCLAAGTEVLTDSGWKGIEDVTRADRVWDGVEWVATDGAVCNGERSVVTCWGVRMTSDHKVLTAEGWHEAQEILDGEPTHRFNRPDFRLPHGDSACGKPTDPREERESPLAAPLRVRRRGGSPWAEPAAQDAGAAEVLRVPPRGNARGGARHARQDGAPCVEHLGGHAAAMHQPSEQGLAKLRRAWDRGVRALGGVLRGVLGGHAPLLAGWPLAGQAGQRGAVRAGQLPVGHRSRAGPQSQTAVFDIVNAGPRNRFVVRGAVGPLIVHNCLQIASGFVFDEDRVAHEIHRAKIDALESIIEEAAGAPVLVSYNFVPDLERLRKHFRHARVLDTNPQTIRDWNEGRISILLAHPASAGHGLNMAEGGNILARFGWDWNLENYMQILERIGPNRQRQAGLKRAVYDYPIVARRTFDEVVLDRLINKRSVQEALLSAMERRAVA